MLILVLWFVCCVVLLVSVLPVYAVDILALVDDKFNDYANLGFLWVGGDPSSNVLTLAGVILAGLALIWGIRKLIKLTNKS